jgi:hypothetical protein
MTLYSGVKKALDEIYGKWSNSFELLFRWKGCDTDTAPTNAKRKKMIRGPMTCKKYGEKGHREASAKCPLNGTTKKR